MLYFLTLYFWKEGKKKSKHTSSTHFFIRRKEVLSQITLYWYNLFCFVSAAFDRGSGKPVQLYHNSVGDEDQWLILKIHKRKRTSLLLAMLYYPNSNWE